MIPCLVMNYKEVETPIKILNEKKKELRFYEAITYKKKKEATDLMALEEISLCDSSICIASKKARTIQDILVDEIDISEALISMVCEIGVVFNYSMSKNKAKALILATCSSFTEKSFFYERIPVSYGIVSGAVEAGRTEALGWSLTVDFARRRKFLHDISNLN